MNIYIPDIKLPKDEPGAFQVIVMYVGADRKLRAECEGTHEVTIVPPHGRLGDLDKLEQMFVDIDNAPYSGFDGLEAFYSAEDAAQIIRLAPTVIPADPAEEGE